MNSRPAVVLTPLTPAAIVIIDGADAATFANAQFTNDARALAVGRWQWSAWLDAQGRVRHFFALLRIAQDRLLAWQPLGDADSMRESLTRYVFRAKLTLEAPQGWSLSRIESAQSVQIAPDQISNVGDQLLIAQPGAHARLACLRLDESARFDEIAAAEWRRADIEARLPLIAEQTSAQFVPQALQLDRIGAIRFDKGCYPGQEIAARLHFRGGNKRSLQQVEVDAATAQPGSALDERAGIATGHVLYAVERADGHFDALAVVRDADVTTKAD